MKHAQRSTSRQVSDTNLPGSNMYRDWASLTDQTTTTHLQDGLLGLGHSLLQSATAHHSVLGIVSPTCCCSAATALFCCASVLATMPASARWGCISTVFAGAIVRYVWRWMSIDLFLVTRVGASEGSRGVDGAAGLREARGRGRGRAAAYLAVSDCGGSGMAWRGAAALRVRVHCAAAATVFAPTPAPALLRNKLLAAL